MADVIFFLPNVATATVAPARLIDVIGAAVVTRQFVHDVVLVGAATGVYEVLALHFKLGQAPFGNLDLLQQFFALRAGAERFGEQKILVARFVELALPGVIGFVDLPEFRLKLGQQLARLITFLTLLDQALLKLQTDRVFGRPIGGSTGSRGNARRWRTARRRSLVGNGGWDWRRLAVDRFARTRRFVIAAKWPPALRRGWGSGE